MALLAPGAEQGEDAKKLVSAQERGLWRFERIPAMPGMPVGGVGIAPACDDLKARKAFYAYLKQPVVQARLEAEGFERAGPGAPHPWFLVLRPGVVPPVDKVLCLTLTPDQRAKIETNRQAALARLARTNAAAS